MITWLTIAFILVAGFSMTFIAMRLVEQHAVPAVYSPDLVRPIRIVEAEDLRRRRRRAAPQNGLDAGP